MNHDFYDDYLAAWNNWNYKQCCELKKLKHFALVLSETIIIKKHINSKNIYNVPKLTDPLMFLIKSCARYPFLCFSLLILIV